MQRFRILSLLALLVLPGVLQPAHAADGMERATGKDFTDLGSKTTIYPKWFKESFWDLNDDIAEARQAGKTGIMVYTSTKSCSYCIAFIEKSLGDPEIQQRVRKRFDVLGLEVIADTEITDVDGKTYHVKDFLKKYRAYFTPTLLFFGKDGELLLNIAGYYPPSLFKHVLDYLEGEHYRKESWRDYKARTVDKYQSKARIQLDKELFGLAVTNLDRRRVKTGRPLMVLFEKQGCANCSSLHREVLSVKSTRAWVKRFDAAQVDAGDTGTVIVKPDGGKRTVAEWAKELNIAYYPSFVFFDEQGKEVFRIDTYTRNARLEGTLELVLNKGYLDEPQLQRWRRKQFVEEHSEKDSRGEK